MTESETHLAEFLVLVQICLGLVFLIGIWVGIGLILDFIGQRLKRCGRAGGRLALPGARKHHEERGRGQGCGRHDGGATGMSVRIEDINALVSARRI